MIRNHKRKSGSFLDDVRKILQKIIISNTTYTTTRTTHTLYVQQLKSIKWYYSGTGIRYILLLIIQNIAQHSQWKAISLSPKLQCMGIVSTIVVGNKRGLLLGHYHTQIRRILTDAAMCTYIISQFLALPKSLLIVQVDNIIICPKLFRKYFGFGHTPVDIFIQYDDFEQNTVYLTLSLLCSKVYGKLQ